MGLTDGITAHHSNRHGHIVNGICRQNAGKRLRLIETLVLKGALQNGLDILGRGLSFPL